MSYILEALKQSEYTRQQGKVPTLNTLPPPMMHPSVEPPARRVLPYLLLAGLLLALAVVLAWWQPWPAPEQIRIIAAAYTAAPAAADAPAVPPQPPASTPEPPSAAQSPALSPLPPAVAQTVPPVAPPQAEPAAAQPTPLPAPAPATAAALAAPVPPAAPSPAQAAAAIAPAPARVEAVQPPAAPPRPPSRVLSFHELPVAVQERIPRLAVSGFSYTEEPEMRMAVVNDRILRQGDQASPGIVLERIASDGVIFSYQGYRFRPR